MKWGGEGLIQWIIRRCIWKCEESLKTGKNECIITLYKGKGDKDESTNYRRISLLSVPGNVYDKILKGRVFKRGTSLIQEGVNGSKICLLHLSIKKRRLIECTERSYGKCWKSRDKLAA